MEMSPECHQRLKRRKPGDAVSAERLPAKKPWTKAGHRAATDGRRACRRQGGHRQEPGVRTVPPPTPGCSPDTPSTSCRSCPLARLASPAGVAVRLAVPSPISLLPTLEGKVAKAVLFCSDSPVTQNRRV